nr:MAG TPA: hypothetical protein [Caudoviricetes sp.]
MCRDRSVTTHKYIATKKAANVRRLLRKVCVYSIKKESSFLIHNNFITNFIVCQ